MKFVRYDSASRATWTAEQSGLTLLVVRDKPSRHKLHYWWRVRRGEKNLAKGNCRDAKHGFYMVTAAYKDLMDKKSKAEASAGFEDIK